MPIPSSCLLVPGRVVLRDNTETALATIQRLNRQKLQREEGIGGFFYEFLELLIAKDLHHLQELEDRTEEIEDRVLAGKREEFNPGMTALRRN